MEEVHLWRGSAEQRALRARLRKSGQFAYFKRQLDWLDWDDKTVLDFGGNAGNLLLDADGAMRPENYYCLDVLREALAEGGRKFPRAHWIHYDRYNCSFNPEGVAGLPVPELDVEFDAILAYSVFTHTGLEEMRELVGQLETRLKPGGALAFTFIDPHFNSHPETGGGNNLKWRLERARETNPMVDVESLLARSRGAAWCALVDGTELYIDGDGVWDDEALTCMTYHVYYTTEFMRREFPRATIRPPLNGDMQHCCIIRREV